MKKWLKITLIALLIIVLALAATVTGIYWTRFATIATLDEVIPSSFYTVDFKADYKLDELLSRNLVTDQVFVDEALDIMYPMLPLEMEAPPLMCSVFTAESPEGEHICGRNFDLSEIHCLLIRTSPKDGYRSISALIPEIIDIKNFPIDSLMDKMKLLIAPYAITDGINEKGLGVAGLVVNGDPTYQDTGKTPITTNLALRLMLDKAASTDEAVELLSHYDMHASGGSNYHFYITDTTGKSVVVEYYNNEMTVTDSNILTNFYLREDAPRSTSKDRCYERFEIIKNALEECGGIVDMQKAADILQEAEMDDYYDGGYVSTQWTEVFNLEKGIVKMYIDRDYDNAHEFSIADFDK